MALNARQRRFVEEYLVDLNATQAAIRSGYAERTARQVGSENLTKPHIIEAVRAAQAERSKRTEITQDAVLKELAKIGFSDIRKVVAWRGNVTVVGEDPDTGEPQARAFNEVVLKDSVDIDDATAAAISEVGQTKEGALKVKLHDKLGALEKIGKHLGMFKEQVELSGPDGGPVEVSTTDPVEAAKIYQRLIGGG